MSLIKLMHAKLHRVRVTFANENYLGSITIDSVLLDKVGILPLEEVEIVNISNGNRWNTYVLPGESGSGCIEPNGGGALLSKPGDILIIYANEQKQREEVLKSGHLSKVILSNDSNGIGSYLEQRIVVGNNGVNFDSQEVSCQPAVNVNVFG
jgi:aspartate 1-decarboxylase